MIPSESLLSPTDHALRDPLAFPLEDYGDRFVDIGFWRPYVEKIAARHGIPVGSITMGEPGTFPTFILNRVHVVKLFGRPFDGLRCWAVERDVARHLGEARLPIPVPAIIGAGVLSRDPDWVYTVMPLVEGEPFAARGRHLAARERLRIAGDLGVMVRALHDLPVPIGTVLGDGWDGWRSFVEGQRRGVTERQREWNVLSPHLVDEIDGYVAGYRVPGSTAPSLVHADLHDHHVLGGATGVGGWDIHAVIDWGDARAGDRFYELPALHLGVFHGDRAMLASFLEAYGWNDFRSDAFVRRAMTMTLLHEFNVLPPRLADAPSLDHLAESLWRV